MDKPGSVERRNVKGKFGLRESRKFGETNGARHGVHMPTPLQFGIGRSRLAHFWHTAAIIARTVEIIAARFAGLQLAGAIAATAITRIHSVTTGRWECILLP